MPRANPAQVALAYALKAQKDGLPQIAMRQVTIGDVNSSGECKIIFAGETPTESYVKVASSICPIPGATGWCLTDGYDWFLLATLTPAGPAWATMRKNATQSIANTSWTAISWGSVIDNSANGVTQNSNGFTVQVPGIYSVSGNFCIDSFGTTGEFYMRLTKNGTAFGTAGTRAPGNLNNAARISATQIVSCAVGDVINASVYQSSTVSKSTNVAAGENVLSMVWLGPVGA